MIHGSCIFESFGRKTSIDKYHHFHLNFFMQNEETKYVLEVQLNKVTETLE